MSFPVARVGSIVLVKGQIGKVITGVPTFMVEGGGAVNGSGGVPADVAIFDTIGMETEDMTSEERAAYLEKKYGIGAADGFDRASSSPDYNPGSANVNAPNVPSKLIGCGDLQNSTPDSTKISKRFSVSDLSSNVYQAELRHSIPNTTAIGMSRADTMCNLRHLATNSLDPLFDWMDKNASGYSFKIGSGFRNASGSSDHNKGSASDLHLFKNGSRASREELRQMAIRILQNANIPFTQFLLEYQNSSSPGWIHIANRKNGSNSAMRIGYTFNGSNFHPNVPTSA